MNRHAHLMRLEDGIRLLHLRPEDEARQLAELLSGAQLLPSTRPIPYAGATLPTSDIFRIGEQDDHSHQLQVWTQKQENNKKNLAKTYKTLLPKLTKEGFGTEGTHLAHHLAMLLATLGLTAPLAALKKELREIRQAEEDVYEAYCRKGLAGVERITTPDIASPYYKPVQLPPSRQEKLRYFSR